ncbi:hypothetical protein FNV43_RR25850 [Rhamnella rubrinervis]|uniref:Uncharacterized protein n=1 Tax=Rhamnella rubrinervis TaxID=2594499 RepID=A0A8K0DHR7_9ROSA|nr:hypothetical protein FNV43_RR25850 [Rhamnella rubrinervis]
MDYFTLLQSLCVSLLLFFTFLFSIKWKTMNQTSPSRFCGFPPSPKALPIIGHLHLLADLPHMSLTTLAHKLGPIIHLRLGRVPTLIVSSAHYARLVLKTHDHIFATRPQLLAAQCLSFGCSDVTFSPYGPYWRQARKICVTELLSTKRVSSFKTVRDEEVNRMLNSVLAQSDSEAVDMSKLFFTLANDILCRVAFGRRFVEGSGEGQQYHLAEVLAETQALLAGFSVGDFFPEWKWINWACGLKRRLEKNLKDLRRVCDEIIGEHMRNDLINNGSTTKEREDDLVDVLIRVQQRHDLEVPITDDNLKALVLDMFVAGTDTTATTLEWTMTELARHPRVLKKAQQQVREVASNSGKVDETHLHQLPYVKAAVKESMRLHPPVPLLVPRESMDNCNLDGYQIPAKTRVLINAYAIGRDPESWEDPLLYKPERFEEDVLDVKDHQDFRFLAFGGGRRGCPGYVFALATVEIALARLLYHFDWSLPPEVGPDDVDLDEIFGLATRKKSALVLVPTPNMDYQLMDADVHY